jgi:hypothetical protein
VTCIFRPSSWSVSGDGMRGWCGESKKPTRLSLGWVDVFVSTFLLPSRFAHPLTRVGLQQQQQQPQRQNIELETVKVMDLGGSKLSTAADALRQRRSSFAPLAVVLKVRRRDLDVKMAGTLGPVRRCLRWRT